MTTVGNIADFLNEIAPFETQESWDNSGFLIGDPDKPVEKIAVALDVTNDTLRQADAFGADLLVSHHPVIFNPVKDVLAGSPAYYAVRHNIDVISVHTCWDLAEGGVNDVLANLIGLSDITPICEDENGHAMLRMGTLKTAVPAEGFADVVAAALETVVRVSLPEKSIRTVAVCGGAGASMLPQLAPLHVDAYVTGDAKHNDFLDAVDLDISLLAAGHYETETVSMPVLAELLRKAFPDLSYKVLSAPPVRYIG